jgi:hypothetical protein
MEVSQIIKQIAEGLDCLYLRATDEDANVRIDEIDLQGLPIVIYNNLPIVAGLLANNHQEITPLEISVYKKAYFDDETTDSDLLINECRVIARKIVLGLLPFMAVAPEDYEIDTLNRLQQFDAILTGVQINIDFTENISCG